MCLNTLQATEIARWTVTLATNLDAPSLIPSTYKVEEETQLPKGDL